MKPTRYQGLGICPPQNRTRIRYKLGWRNQIFHWFFPEIWLWLLGIREFQINKRLFEWPQNGMNACSFLFTCGNAVIEEYKNIVNIYIRAKDRHLPHLMEIAFSEDAVLKMDVNTDVISFPSQVVGLEDITNTLIQEFHAQYENIYTFCINDSAIVLDNGLRCRWLVGMTDIASGSLRMGYGHYHWKFKTRNEDEGLRAHQLAISINNMSVLPAESAGAVFPWFGLLPHPWISIAELSQAPPNIALDHEFLTSKFSD